MNENDLAAMEREHTKPRKQSAKLDARARPTLSA